MKYILLNVRNIHGNTVRIKPTSFCIDRMSHWSTCHQMAPQHEKTVPKLNTPKSMPLYMAMSVAEPAKSYSTDSLESLAHSHSSYHRASNCAFTCSWQPDPTDFHANMARSRSRESRFSVFRVFVAWTSNVSDGCVIGRTTRATLLPSISP